MTTTQVFAAENKGALYYPVKAEHELAKTRRNREEGACFAWSLLWIERSIQLGEVRSQLEIGNQAMAEWIQALYEKGFRGGLRRFAGYRDHDDQVRRVLTSRKLEVIERKEFYPDSAKCSRLAVKLVKWMLGRRGYYLVYAGAESDVPHWMACRISTGAHYFFDSNFFSYKITGDAELREFLRDHIADEYPEYDDNDDGFIEGILVKLA